MATHKVADLQGEALDKAVALAEGYGGSVASYSSFAAWASANMWAPSSLWQDAGPIIEQQHISISTPYGNGEPGWVASMQAPRGTIWHLGPTPLVAAMRVRVAAVYGDFIELPELARAPALDLQLSIA